MYNDYSGYVTKWGFWQIDKILYIADCKEVSQYPTFRVMVIDLVTKVGTWLPSGDHKVVES